MKNQIECAPLSNKSQNIFCKRLVKKRNYLVTNSETSILHLHKTSVELFFLRARAVIEKIRKTEEKIKKKPPAIKLEVLGIKPWRCPTFTWLRPHYHRR